MPPKRNDKAPMDQEPQGRKPPVSSNSIGGSKNLNSTKPTPQN